jgi:hypothetical protein
MEILSKRWGWVESARAWDVYQDQVRVRAAQRALAERAAAEAEKWARRFDELPDIMYAVMVDAFNDLAATARLAADPDLAVSIRDKGIQVRSFVAAASLAERALEMVARRNRVTNAAGTSTPAPTELTGGAKEALRAYQEYQDALGRADPDPERDDEGGA